MTQPLPGSPVDTPRRLDQEPSPLQAGDSPRPAEQPAILSDLDTPADIIDNDVLPNDGVSPGPVVQERFKKTSSGR